MLAMHLVTASQQWHTEMEEEIFVGLSNDPDSDKLAFSFSLHAVRADATNSSAVQSRKAHVLELRSSYGLLNLGGLASSGLLNLILSCLDAGRIAT
jgi:hypothetical protein